MSSIHYSQPIAEDRSLRVFTAIIGFVAVALLIGGLTVVISTEDAGEWARIAAADPGSTQAIGWLFTLAEVAGALSILGIAAALAGAPRGLAWGGGATVAVGFVLNAAVTMSPYYTVAALVPAAAAGDAAALAVMTAERARVNAADAINVLLLGVGLMLLGSASLRVVHFPRWLGWLGMVAGVVGVGAVLGLSLPAADPLRPLSGVLYMVWTVGMSLRLLLPWREAGRAKLGPVTP